MAQNKRNGGGMGPLSIGDVVTGGIRLYRDHFQEYYRLALIGYLWVIIPIYGWAKYSAMYGLIGRLAFREAIERPETVQEGSQQVEPRMWTFLGAGCLIGLIFTGALFGGGLAVGLILGLMAGILGGESVLMVVISLLSGLLLIFLYLWLYTKLSIGDLVIAIENLGASESISRGWQLTNGMTGRLMGVYLLTFIISLPVVLVIQVALQILMVVLANVLPMDLPLGMALYMVILFGISFAGGAFVIPLWQTIKAILYYDLRNRQEGMGLNLDEGLIELK